MDTTSNISIHLIHNKILNKVLFFFFTDHVPQATAERIEMRYRQRLNNARLIVRESPKKENKSTLSFSSSKNVRNKGVPLSQSKSPHLINTQESKTHGKLSHGFQFCKTSSDPSFLDFIGSFQSDFESVFLSGPAGDPKHVRITRLTSSLKENNNKKWNPMYVAEYPKNLWKNRLNKDIFERFSLLIMIY